MTTTTRPQGAAVRIRYTNWKGETRDRTIVPVRIWFGSSEWHPAPQYLLDAWDTEKECLRNFAMGEVRGWKQCG